MGKGVKTESTELAETFFVVCFLAVLVTAAIIFVDCWATGFCAQDYLLGNLVNAKEACADVGMVFVDGKNNYCIDEGGGFHEILIKNNKVFINTGD